GGKYVDCGFIAARANFEDAYLAFEDNINLAAFIALSKDEFVFAIFAQANIVNECSQFPFGKGLEEGRGFEKIDAPTLRLVHQGLLVAYRYIILLQDLRWGAVRIGVGVETVRSCLVWTVVQDTGLLCSATQQPIGPLAIVDYA